MILPHSLEQPIEPRELDARDRALQLRGAEVPAGEPGKTGAGPHRARAVVHVDGELVEVVSVGDHDAALAGGDDLVELQAERARVAKGAQPLSAEARTRSLA